MQHKGVSCGPLSFIHAAAACELPAWQSCRRVLWHPVDSGSHPSIRGPQSRAGAHLHKKYIDTFLTYVRQTANLFLFCDSGNCLISLDRQTQRQPILRGLVLYIQYLDMCLCLYCAQRSTGEPMQFFH